MQILLLIQIVYILLILKIKEYKYQNILECRDNLSCKIPKFKYIGSFNITFNNLAEILLKDPNLKNEIISNNSSIFKRDVHQGRYLK